MKLLRIILVLFATGTVVHSQGQLIYNGGFENYCGAQDTYNPFNTSCGSGTVCTTGLNCVPGWSVSHGTPQIDGGAVEGNNCAFMWSGLDGSGQILGEGIFTNVCFIHNENYVLSFWVRLTPGLGSTAGNLFVYAASGVITSSINTGDPIPTISGEILYSGLVSSTTWTKVSINYSPSSSVPLRNQLEIYPYQSTANITWVEIDDIEITRSTCCATYVLYQNTNVSTPIPHGLPPNTNAGSYIRAGNNVGSPSEPTGDVSLISGSSANFRAGDYVSLEPGFLADYGSNFLGVISPCTSATNCNYNSTCADNLVRLAQVNFPSVVIKDSSFTAATDIKVYPNPTNGKLFVDLIPAKDISVTVTNLMGIPLFHEEYHNILYETKEIDLSKLPDGIYIISINRDGILKTKTITVMK
jgi:hypothetical protein